MNAEEYLLPVDINDIETPKITFTGFQGGEGLIEMLCGFLRQVYQLRNLEGRLGIN